MSAGEGGKVLLAGFAHQGGQALPQGAWAAGLAGAEDYPNFVTFARFVLQQPKPCDAYWLMLPAEQVGEYALELRAGADVWLGCAQYQEGRWQLTEDASVARLDDLLQAAGSLPGVMRRELSAMASAISVPLPA